jgi:ligand-binding sensor domain-containing protein/AraC-like DNA-binding protein
MKSVILQIVIVFISFKLVAQIETFQLQKAEVPNTVDFFQLKMPGGNEQNSINCFIQDSTGQMWIATKDGLIRYNGKKMFVYRSDAENPNSIGDNFVTNLFLDNDSRLWVCTQKGLWRYRKEKDDFITANKDLNEDYITDVKQDSTGVIWIVNHKANRLYRFDPSTGELTLVYDNKLNENGKPELLRLLIDRSGRFFLIDKYRGILRYYPDTGTFSFIRLAGNDTINKYHKKLKSIFTKIIQDRKNPDLFWIGTNLGFIVKYDLLTGKQKRLIYNRKLTNHGFHCFNSDIYQDSAQNIWITTWFYGIFKILPGNKRYIHFLPAPQNKHSISNSIAKTIYRDKAGYFWFGTEYQGVDIMRKNKKFTVIPVYPVQQDDLPPEIYLSVTQDSIGRVWVGSENGIFTLNPHSLKCQKQNSLFSGAMRFFSLYYDRYNRLWAGTEKGVFCKDNNGKTLYRFTHDKDDYQSISSNFVNTIMEDREGNFWFGTLWGGVNRYNPVSGRFYRFLPDETDPKSISHGYITKIFQSRDGKIWMGTLDGLNRFNPKAGNFTVFKNDKNNILTIGSPVINDINETGDSLWVATQGGGLNLFEKKAATFKRFTTKDGLPDNNIKAVLTDKHGNLWLSTTKNIVKFNPKTGQSVTYTESDGVENRIYITNLGWQELNFSEALGYKDKQGYLYFGGIGGLLFFHPDSLPENTYHSQLLIDKFIVNGTERSINDNKIVLKPGENQLEVEFTLMNLIQAEKNIYQWKLIPYDTVWKHGNYLSKATYFNLPSGTYKLLYKAANNDGIWTVASKPLIIKINPRFYQTTGFIILVASLILLLLASFAAYRKYLKIQIEKRRKMLRYSWSKLDDSEAQRINDKLLTAMENKNIYLEPDLSLNKLADIIGEKPNYLSQVINQFHKQNFFEFVNTYRIEEAKRLLRDTALKVEAVAYDSGFNSLSTFNSVFKKITKTTPSQYRKKTGNPST